VFLLYYSLSFRASPRLFGPVAPFGLYHFSNSLSIPLGFLLIYLSINLFQRRLVAWWLALIGSGIKIIIDVSHLQAWPAAISPVITFVLLLMYRKKFTVRSERRNIFRGMALMIGSLALALVYRTIGFLLLPVRDIGISFSLSKALIRALREFVLISNDDLVPRTAYAFWLLYSLRIIGVLAYVFAFYSLFRPIAYRYGVLPY
jgi:phosphatidylglycerol lysyltransferase